MHRHLGGLSASPKANCVCFVCEVLYFGLVLELEGTGLLFLLYYMYILHVLVFTEGTSIQS